VIDAECVGCNLCFLACPVDGCITMVRTDTGTTVMTWDHHPNNPLRKEQPA
jgi:dihydropyrimidine dehydrogenase (NAD+) subunit PreA